MIRWTVLILLLLSATPLAADFLPQPVTAFLAGRQLAAQIDFTSGSAQLDPAGRREIDRTVANLRPMSGSSHLLRIEGFADPNEGNERERLELSLQRALAVETYLRSHHRWEVPRFLTGIGRLAQERKNPAELSLVEIAVYPNPWAGDEDPPSRPSPRP